MQYGKIQKASMINLAYFDFSDKKKRKLAKSHSFEKQKRNYGKFLDFDSLVYIYNELDFEIDADAMFVIDMNCKKYDNSLKTVNNAACPTKCLDPWPRTFHTEYSFQNSQTAKG
ncbi:hypothetical protein U0070_016970 [Myodes glareolus]|uniref:Uncharacterized protein n=1 Tax=Myodes glareolus TaxID=447135 RepID=A0AAW0I1I0_MYOGA